MNLKNKVLIYNFLGFAILFIFLRYGLALFFDLNSYVISFIAAISSSIVAPKFALTKLKGVSSIVMKWIFIKGFKVL